MPFPEVTGDSTLTLGEQEPRRGLGRLRERYDLEAGRLRCRCLIRRWKFCPKIKGMAGGRVTPNLLRCGEEEKEEVKDPQEQGEGMDWGTALELLVRGEGGELGRKDEEEVEGKVLGREESGREQQGVLQREGNAEGEVEGVGMYEGECERGEGREG